jgi:hypothetical protein
MEKNHTKKLKLTNQFVLIQMNLNVHITYMSISLTLFFIGGRSDMLPTKIDTLEGK